MKCNSCGKTFPDEFKKCPYCGFPKTTENSEINLIKQNLNYLKNLKNYFEQAVANIENSLNQMEKTIPQQSITPTIKESPHPVRPAEKKAKQPFLEKFLGEKFLLTIGIIAILFASAFFLKYSFEKNLFTPLFRVTVTTIAGIGFMAAGYYLKSKYRIFGVILISGGIAVLFFSNFASLVLYGFYGTITAFIINLILVACSLFLAVTFNSQWVSIIGIGGAYLTPLSLKSALTNDFGFFTYLFVLTLAPIFLAYKKKWSLIVILSNTFTVMWFYMWYYSYFKTNSSLHFIYFGIWFYTAFTIATLFYLKEKNTHSLYALSPLIAMFFYPLISVKTMGFAGSHTLSPGFLYAIAGILFAVASRLKNLNDRERVFLFVTGILTIFTGIYFNFNTVSFTAYLSITLVLSVYLFLITEKKWIPVLNLTLIAFLFFKATTYDIFENLKFNFSHFAFLNYKNILSRVMEYFAVIAAITLNSKAALRKNAKWFSYIAGFFAGLTMLAFLTYEASSVFYICSGKGQSMGISLTWAVFAFILFYIGTRKDKLVFTVPAYILFGGVLLKLFFIDIISLSALYRVLTFFITGIVLIVSSYVYYKFSKTDKTP